MTNCQMTAQVGLLLILLDEQFVGAGVQFPVDVPDGFARVVWTVLGKLHRKAVHRALVDTRNETFHHLFGHELHVVELRYFRQVNRICHRSNFRAQRYTFFRLSWKLNRK